MTARHRWAGAHHLSSVCYVQPQLNCAPVQLEAGGALGVTACSGRCWWCLEPPPEKIPPPVLLSMALCIKLQAKLRHPRVFCSGSYSADNCTQGIGVEGALALFRGLHTSRERVEARAVLQVRCSGPVMALHMHGRSPLSVGVETRKASSIYGVEQWPCMEAEPTSLYSALLLVAVHFDVA